MVTIKNPDTMKPIIGIICIVAPIVAACWDIITPAVKKAVQKCTNTIKLHL